MIKVRDVWRELWTQSEKRITIGRRHKRSRGPWTRCVKRYRKSGRDEKTAFSYDHSIPYNSDKLYRMQLAAYVERNNIMKFNRHLIISQTPLERKAAQLESELKSSWFLNYTGMELTEANEWRYLDILDVEKQRIEDQQFAHAQARLRILTKQRDEELKTNSHRLKFPVTM